MDVSPNNPNHYIQFLKYISYLCLSNLFYEQKLNTKHLIKSAKEFCATQSKVYRTELYGITDGKAVGTFVEHLFKDFLAQRYDLTIGNSASGLDLPSINTDIKVTSIKQPQSSCPYKDSKQKIYGLGYNLIIFVYRKEDDVYKEKECWISSLVHL